MSNDAAARWEARFGVDEYVYGTEPNDFLVEAASNLPPGRALCIADGEGRNGVWLAEQGHDVTSIEIGGRSDHETEAS